MKTIMVLDLKHYLRRLLISEIDSLTRPGVQQCQAQGLVFCPLTKIFGLMDQGHHFWSLAIFLLKVRVD